MIVLFPISAMFKVDAEDRTELGRCFAANRPLSLRIGVQQTFSGPWCGGGFGVARRNDLGCDPTFVASRH
jgi:hypothetical protein